MGVQIGAFRLGWKPYRFEQDVEHRVGHRVQMGRVIVKRGRAHEHVAYIGGLEQEQKPTRRQHAHGFPGDPEYLLKGQMLD